MRTTLLTLSLLAALPFLAAACGSSTDPATTFECGDQACALRQEYCEAFTGDLGPVTTTYTCKPLPNACGTVPICACLSGETCGLSCSVVSDGALLAHCYGA